MVDDYAENKQIDLTNRRQGKHRHVGGDAHWTCGDIPVWWRADFLIFSQNHSQLGTVLVRKAEGLNLNNSGISYCNSLINNSLLLFCSQQHSLCLSFSLSYLKTHTQAHTHAQTHTANSHCYCFSPCFCYLQGCPIHSVAWGVNTADHKHKQICFWGGKGVSHIAVLTASLSRAMKWDTTLCQNCPLVSAEE